MNKKIAQFTVLLLVTSPLFLQQAVKMLLFSFDQNTELSLFSTWSLLAMFLVMLVIPMVLALISVGWQIFGTETRLLYGAILVTSFLLQSVPLFLSESVGVIILNTVLQMILPYILFEITVRLLRLRQAAV